MAAKQKFNFQPFKSAGNETVAKPTVPAGSIAAGNDKIDLEERAAKRNADNVAFTMKSISRNKIRKNKKNDYEIVNIESLEESILNNGLLHNLVVIYSTEEDKYIIEAGERRCTALDNLIEKWDNCEDKECDEYKLYVKNVLPYKTMGYPCKVAASLGEDVQYDYDENISLEDVPEEVIESEIRLIISNEEVRERNPATIARSIRRLNELYSAKNKGKKSNKEKINVNKAIATALNITDTQVKNYKKIDNLIPELKEEFEKNNITLKEGSNYAKLDEEEQQAILDMLKRGQRVTKTEIEQLIKERSILKDILAGKKQTIKELEEEKARMQEEYETLNLKQQQNQNSEEAQRILESKERELEQKESEIETLRKELSKVKSEPKVLKRTFSSEQALIAKNELAVKASFETCKRDIMTFLNCVKDLNQSLDKAKDNPDVKEMGVITEEEMKSFISQLKDMLEED